MKALLFGSIGTLAETSELQREAFNQAFNEHNLDWNWPREQYQELLKDSGGKQRIASFAESKGETVDAEAVHATKSRIFQDLLQEKSIQPRSGVADTIRKAKEEGIKLGLVTTTSRENIDNLLGALSTEISADTFDVIIDSSQVEAKKPAADAYQLALEKLGVEASEAKAIEDNQDGLSAAQAAGISSYAFGGANTQAHDFEGAEAQLSSLDFDQLQRKAA
ncbi:HAD family hydrolase [Tunicatimonas pelagia]|uniref:HAD family hydrolase n=1 Tax=Tunicatimonas pelagia TaxID=931531 RepID=UPI002666D72B|nr:HAD-IA family hydrolase [Tunicatimonas pelagia]WKN41868.1 HAD-IA family hydrolase [Tunicatimonas pelagia]